ncbi:DUF1801 domain-containing protein [Maribacter sp. MMG018]|uniref:DUF1801 domain-containing protein n=1 Tax=Maribacter sp. MMG018 TaxID=2822688 RepID=UPI001B38EAE6|nr:DUF1801 domain-containing protein [Maribacter sp. MMG018]MBQ4913392.1 DUF1801 domain-containing protein [Maribacter sp. MMG018]
MKFNTDTFYLNQDEPNRGCLLAIRSLILKLNCHVSETKKYGMPCFCFKKKPFCYLWIDKKTTEPYVLFVNGSHLQHTQLETGNRSKMKIFRLDPNKDLPVETLQSLFFQTITLYTSGTVRS